MSYEALLAENTALKDLNQQLLDKYASMQEKVLALQYQLDLFRKQIYNSKSERFVPADDRQLTIFSILESACEESPGESPAEQVGAPAPEAEKQTISYERKKTRHKGRQLIEGCGHLEVREEYLTLECQEGEVEIGKEITRKLAIDIQKLYVKCIIRPKYKNTSTGQIRVAELPSEALPKCEADESLLAQVVVSKYVDHLPEYRQQQIYKRQGVVISPSTMNNWVHRIAELLRPVAECIKKQILQSGYIQMDESTIKVMFVKKGTTHQGYMWVIVDPVSKSGYFEYRHGRGRAGPAEMLRDYKGKIQSDGYTVYETIDRIMAEVEHYNCWAHARRKFVEATANDQALAHTALTMIQQLYKVEEHCRTQQYSTGQRKAFRAEKSVPILEELKSWIDRHSLTVSPSSPIGKALSYTTRRWQSLIRYAGTGDVEIDNNLVENAIRPLALGRKNYLFAGGHEAALNIATFYTVLTNCKSQDINPYEYLYWFLKKVPDTNINAIETLTPASYKNQE